MVLVTSTKRTKESPSCVVAPLQVTKYLIWKQVASRSQCRSPPWVCVSGEIWWLAIEVALWCCVGKLETLWFHPQHEDAVQREASSLLSQSRNSLWRPLTVEETYPWFLFCAQAKAARAESSNSKTEHFLTKGDVALLLYLLSPWSLSQAGKQHPKVRTQSKTGELHLV